MSAEQSARSVRQAEGLDPVRAFQRVLYRSAKQDRTRRFHALYDKLVRSDVMWRAWVTWPPTKEPLVSTAYPSPRSKPEE